MKRHGAKQQRIVHDMRPFLVEKRPSSPRKNSLLTYWHLLSLDAPTVAATWTYFIGWCAGIHLPLVTAVAMFLAVWILYAADRLLDAKPFFNAPFAPGLEERHRFHNAHRSRFVLGISLAVLPLAFCLHHSFEPALHLYILLACLLAGWLLLVHARSQHAGASHRLPKELAVGIFFPAAVFIPTVSREPALRVSLIPLAIVLACVCTLNCVFLFDWEHPQTPAQVNPLTRWCLRHVLQVACGCILTCLGLALLSARPDLAWGSFVLVHALPLIRWAYLACGVSVTLLVGLHLRRHRISRLSLRALADLALLTPLPVLGAALVLPRLHS